MNASGTSERKVPKSKQIGTTISRCNVTMEPSPPINEHMVSAVRAIADACVANARVLEECAKRLCGPADNRCGIRVDGNG